MQVAAACLRPPVPSDRSACLVGWSWPRMARVVSVGTEACSSPARPPPPPPPPPMLGFVVDPD